MQHSRDVLKRSRTPVQPSVLKRCNRCRENLPFERFEARTKGRFGLSGSCIACVEERYKTEKFSCSRCSEQKLGEEGFYRGKQGSVIRQPCCACLSDAKRSQTRVRRAEEGREPYHILSNVDQSSRTADCRECGPVHIYATGSKQGHGWRCGKRSDQISAEWYDAKAKIVNKHAAQSWHRVRDVRGHEMRATCSRCGDAPVRWNQSEGRFVCDSPSRRARHAEIERHRKRLKIYGLTNDEYEQMVEQQGAKCAICGGSDVREDSFGGLVIDHDHSTGAVRGLLCHRCNTGIGMMKDDPDVLMKAIEYLERARDRNART